MENSTNNIHVENQDDSSENRWIKVVTGNHRGREKNYFIQQVSKSKSQIAFPC
jgi:hypothetical protein